MTILPSHTTYKRNQPRTTTTARDRQGGEITANYRLPYRHMLLQGVCPAASLAGRDPPG